MTEAERLRELVERSWNEAMADQPEEATFYGWPGRHTRWTDFSPQAIEARHARSEAERKELQAIDTSGLDDVDGVTHALFAHELDNRLAARKFHDEYQPMHQLQGPQQDPAMVIASMPAATEDDLADVVERVRHVGVLVDQSIELMRLGIGAGIVPPAICLRDVPDQIRNQLVADPLDSPLLVPLAEAADELRDQGAGVYRDVVAPAYERLLAFSTDTYLPAGRGTISCRDLPDGDERYAFWTRYYTTTDLTPQEIHDIGKGEVARIGAEMRRIISDVGFDGGLKEFTAHLAADPRFVCTSADDLLTRYRAIAARIDPQLPKLFGRLPRIPYAIEPVPAYAEKSQTAAYYLPGAPDGSRPGTFFANTYDLASRPTWEFESLTLHEAVPGHHLQIALAQELDELPAFRRNAWFTAYGEGWGLYAESLGEELGLYEDPYDRYGAYFGEMWRAIRLVVDTGMHALGWTREQAIAYAEDESGRTDHDVVVEIDRYIVWPGQALAYKIGELELQRLRRDASARLGDRFDVRGFHDEVLRHGALPLEVLRRLIEHWVESRVS
jgi:uncharacterized protein (DUF885 family)